MLKKLSCCAVFCLCLLSNLQGMKNYSLLQNTLWHGKKVLGIGANVTQTAWEYVGERFKKSPNMELMNAILHNNTQTVGYYLQECPQPLNVRYFSDLAPLELALYKDDCKPRIVKQLLDYGADPNLKNKFGEPLLYTFITLFVGEITPEMKTKLRILLECERLDPTIRTPLDHDTVLLAAAQFVSRDIMSMLLSSEKMSPIVNEGNTANETPLILAIKMGNYDVVQELIKHNARVNNTTNEGLNALWYAYKRKESISKGLIKVKESNNELKRLHALIVLLLNHKANTGCLSDAMLQSFAGEFGVCYLENVFGAKQKLIRKKQKEITHDLSLGKKHPLTKHLLHFLATQWTELEKEVGSLHANHPWSSKKHLQMGHILSDLKKIVDKIVLLKKRRVEILQQEMSLHGRAHTRKKIHNDLMLRHDWIEVVEPIQKSLMNKNMSLIIPSCLGPQIRNPYTKPHWYTSLSQLRSNLSSLGQQTIPETTLFSWIVGNLDNDQKEFSKNHLVQLPVLSKHVCTYLSQYHHYTIPKEYDSMILIEHLAKLISWSRSMEYETSTKSEGIAQWCAARVNRTRCCISAGLHNSWIALKSLAGKS